MPVLCHSKRYENDETQRESTETQVLILCTMHFLSQENHTAHAAVTRLHIPAQCLGVCKKDRFRSNLQSNSHIRVQGSELSTCRLLLLTSYCTSNVSTGGANSFPYTGKLTNPHKVAILGWDSFAKLYVEIGPEDFVPTMYWNQEGNKNNWFRWFWTQWKRILLYKQDLEEFALNSSVLKHLTWNLAGMQGVCIRGKKFDLSKSEPSGVKNRIHGLNRLLWFEYLKPPNTLQECNILQLSANLSTKGLLCASSHVWVRFKFLSTQAN